MTSPPTTMISADNAPTLSLIVPIYNEEATIDELHAAIRAGQTTCVEVVQRLSCPGAGL